MLSAVSHRDLALHPTGGGTDPKVIRRAPYKFTKAQLRELDKIRKTTWGKERTNAVDTVAKEWNVPRNSVFYRVYKNGAPSKKAVQKRNSRPVKKEKPVKVAKVDKPEKPQKRQYIRKSPVMAKARTGQIKDTKLRFKITGLEIDNGEIVMTLRT